MLRKITFLADWRCFKKDEFFEFRPGINFLVGDQGCGKSSLINVIRSAPPSVHVDATLIQSLFFDFEKHNPRTRTDPLSGNDTAFRAASIFSSHGQTVKSILSLLPQGKNQLFLLDEPDMALSIRSCYDLLKKMEVAVSNGCQIVAAVHNPILIGAITQVLSLEHKQWMKSEDFIESHKKGQNGT